MRVCIDCLQGVKDIHGRRLEKKNMENNRHVSHHRLGIGASFIQREVGPLNILSFTRCKVRLRLMNGQNSSFSYLLSGPFMKLGLIENSSMYCLKSLAIKRRHFCSFSVFPASTEYTHMLGGRFSKVGTIVKRVR